MSRIIFGFAEEKLDEIDYKILRILATNSRMPSIDLARKINITERIVRYRIKELVRKQIILAFSIQLNQQAINYDYYKVMFYLKNMDSEQEMR
ncbi:MAG: AsnC family transcriptional regulator, partial [Nanoarchaeota archaeon]|nr:AsnC family transcriptional regulator [Nanoarchaeota archaeon]